MKIILRCILTMTVLFMILSCSKSNDELPFNVVVEKKRPFFFGITNVRMLFKDSLIASAYFDKTTYGTFCLGSPDAPYRGKPHLLIRLPDGSIVDLTSPDVISILESRATSRNPCIDKFYDAVEATSFAWPEGTETLLFFPYKFYVNNNILLGMDVAYSSDTKDWNVDKGLVPAIGTVSDNMKTRPSNAHEFSAIFGEPNRIVEWFTE